MGILVSRKKTLNTVSSVIIKDMAKEKKKNFIQLYVHDYLPTFLSTVIAKWNITIMPLAAYHTSEKLMSLWVCSDILHIVLVQKEKKSQLFLRYASNKTAVFTWGGPLLNSGYISEVNLHSL